MSGLSTWLRLWLSGIILGSMCGAASGALYILAAYAIDGAGADGVFGLFLGLVVVGFYACCVGGWTGGLVGCVTGFIAGFAMTVLLRIVTPGAAATATVALVLAAQVCVELAIFRAPTDSELWAYAVVPAITLVPLALVTRKVARDASRPKVTPRDTFAA